MSLRNVIEACQDFVMPLRCIFCGTRTLADEQHICGGCLGDLPWSDAPVLSARPGLNRLIAPLAYEFPIDAAVKALKFRRRLHYGPAFAQLLCRASRDLPDDIDAVLPVPLHWRRKWWRGFNQALEIAQPLASFLDLPVCGAVRRRRATPPQSGLTARQRANNLRAAFCAVRRPCYRHVLVVDDVITTGATTSQLAKVLRRAGVAKVSAIAVARSGQR